MATTILFFFFLLLAGGAAAAADDCSGYSFPSNRAAYASCASLPYLDAKLHYTLTRATNELRLAYRAPAPPSGWVAWGLNLSPRGTGMVGAQALVAFRNSSGAMIAYPTALDSYRPSMAPAALSFPVKDVSAEEVDGEMVVYATIVLPATGKTAWNHVWQVGGEVDGGVPAAHSVSGDNVLSMGTIDFAG